MAGTSRKDGLAGSHPDAEFSPEEIEAARVAFARPVNFLLGVASLDGLPDMSLPEVAFAGRSNVGKSSLINALTSQRQLARASTEPGRTREVNMFLLDGRLRLVDLPGYGFAKASKGTVRRFQDLGRAYLRGRPNLKRVYLLIDSRHGLKSEDDAALAALDLAAVSYQVVLTKADKLKPAEQTAVVAATLKALSRRPAAFPRITLTSAETGAGMADLRAEVLRAGFA
ncbi:MAG: YihA family ribosome biogenesis GTP-binding protein [Alphaproteobacteria bacterium]|jgi:GTP-binding protein|nr:YihA family ribosome biogenesis GTP-binding protein [Alphaproteobacteria bacterium]